jgi:hypothetical protein
MAMPLFGKRRVHVGCVLAAMIGATTGCQAPPQPPRTPTLDLVSVSERSIGIPYGPVVLFRKDGELVALRVIAAPAAGYSIEYEWMTAPASGRGFTTDDGGTGATEEQRGFGHISLGPLYFKWSRASKSSGWLYWPPGSNDFSVCSRTWTSIDEIDLQQPEIHWYTQEMFQR